MKIKVMDIELLVQQVFMKYGCSEDDSKIMANSLILAEMCGVPSHGLRMVAAHCNKFKDGSYSVTENVEIEVETSSFARVNGKSLAGPISAYQCMFLAMKRAKKNGVYVVFANHCNTYSAAFVYALQAAKEGLIGVTFCNTPAQMAPWGGFDKLLGTNPIAYAVPAHKHHPIVFDMATSVVASSKINQAKEKGECIPEGWAITKEGLPTSDAQEAKDGTVLPVGGAKGYGLSMMFDLIAGLVSGAKTLNQVGRFYDSTECMNVGQVFIAIDPRVIIDDEFYEKVDQYIDIIHSSKSSQGKVRVPGDNKFSKMEDAIAYGIEISDALYFELKRLLNEE